MDLISVAVVTGNHTFDELSFQNALSGLVGIVCQIQPLGTFAAQSSQARQKFDVVLFYNYHQDIAREAKSRTALETLGETEQGLVILHHALVAFPQWSLWNDLCGIQARQFTAHKQQRLWVEIAQPHHPITRGLQAWEMVDETYLMESANSGSEIFY